jgi:23S rRNA (adenine2503-C2)-methyltransferase
MGLSNIIPAGNVFMALTKAINSNKILLLHTQQHLNNYCPMLSLEEYQSGLKVLGIQVYRASQIFHAVFKEGKSDYAEMTTLSRHDIDLLKKNLPILSVRPVSEYTSKDGLTKKVLFALNDDLRIESVYMQFRDGRVSVCVSSQVGCQMGCSFCATGKMKFGRNLTYEEIADQVLYFARPLMKKDKRISNVIYMGMGEPFMNYDNVMKSVEMLNNDKCLNIGIRNITISTSGICEGIDKLADSGLQVNLAVSLHSPDQDLRAKLMPVARKYPLDCLMASIKKYISVTNRRVTYEYIMLKGINDSEDQARRLAKLLKGQLCHINLIPYNAMAGKGTKDIMIGSDTERIEKFRGIIRKSAIPVTVRVSLGQDIMAACGQLATKK